MEWTVHPFKSNPKKSAFLVVMILLICLLALATFKNVYFALLALALLIISLRQYFMPTIYILSDEGVTVRFLGRANKRQWSYFRSFYEDNNGILLSPFEKQSRLESFRGIYLIASGNKKEITEFVRQHIK